MGGYGLREAIFGANDNLAPPKPMGYWMLCSTRAMGYKGFDCIGIVNSV